jgi:hypothetical protein
MDAVDALNQERRAQFDAEYAKLDQQLLAEGLPPLREWVSVYPCYLDSERTLTQGRRVPEQFACPEPTAVEIHNAILKSLQVRALICQYLMVVRLHPPSPPFFIFFFHFFFCIIEKV